MNLGTSDYKIRSSRSWRCVARRLETELVAWSVVHGGGDVAKGEVGEVVVAVKQNTD